MGGEEHLGEFEHLVLLAILLHNRIHAVAFAGAICLTAFGRDRLRSWPWWLACVLAGICRLPLWMRWGGLVSPEYQSMHGLGLGLTVAKAIAEAHGGKLEISRPEAGGTAVRLTVTVE